MKFKNEVLVGIVVVLALVVIGVGAYWLTGRQFGSEPNTVVATFQEVGLLTEGNPVKYRGVQVGRVESIELAPSGDGVFVTMTVQPGLKFPPDAAVVLSAQSFFGDWQAALVSQSSPAFADLEFTRASARGVLPGAALPDITELTAVAARIAGDFEILSNRVQIAFTEETAVKLRNAVENVAEVSDQLAGFVNAQTGKYAKVGDNVLAASANFRQASASATEVVNDLQRTVGAGEIHQILQNAQRASQNLQQLSEQLNQAATGVPGLVARADTTLAAFGQTANAASGVLNTLQPQVQQIGPTLAEAQRAIGTLNQVMVKLQQGDGTLGRLLEDPALFEETQRSIVTLRRLLADVQTNPARYIGAFRPF